MAATSRTGLGVFASLLASVLFAVIFYLAGRAQASGEVLYAWRILALPVMYAPLLLHRRARVAVVEFRRRVTSPWWTLPLFLGIAVIINIGTWLFMWAPRNGHGLDSSLGFLLLPIALVLGGRVVLRSHVSRAQWVVVALAALAVAVKILATPELGWVTIAVVGVFTVYFVGRTRLGLASMAGFALETTLALPVAVYFLTREGGWEGETGALVLIGVLSVIAMSAYVGASSLLPIPVFGLLSYVEPMLLVVVALILGEQMHGADVVVYAILAVALALLALAGFRDARRMPGRPR